MMQRVAGDRSLLTRQAARTLPAFRPCSAQHASPRRLRSTPQEKETFPSLETIGTAGTVGLLTPLLLDVQAAFAQNREYGIVEGQIASLYHPAIMLFLFGSSLYAAWLGFQWRRLRLIPEQIKDLKSELPPKDSEGNQPSSPALEAQITDLETTRKELNKGNIRSTHANWGYLLLGVGVLTAIVGPVNTYLRVGKLFPGPHLYAGAGIVVLWAVAASMVPLMQKGNDTARLTHISCNVLNIALFAWQIPTGLEIVQKVFQFTTLP